MCGPEGCHTFTRTFSPPVATESGFPMHNVLTVAVLTVVAIYAVHHVAMFNSLMTPMSGADDIFPFVRK